MSNWITKEGMNDILGEFTKEMKNGIQLKRLNNEEINTRNMCMIFSG